MNRQWVGAAAAVAAEILCSTASAASLPGDHGRPADGVPTAARPPAGPMPRATVPAPAIALAVRAAETIASACKQFPLGVAVVNAAGEPILIYLPDGSAPSHGYMALRKAFSAITFHVPTSELRARVEREPQLADQVRADPNLVAFSGGILLKAQGQIIGAIGVSGAEPGAHDEECGLNGVRAIESQLK